MFVLATIFAVLILFNEYKDPPRLGNKYKDGEEKQESPEIVVFAPNGQFSMQKVLRALQAYAGDEVPAAELEDCKVKVVRTRPSLDGHIAKRRQHRARASGTRNHDDIANSLSNVEEDSISV